MLQTCACGLDAAASPLVAAVGESIHEIARRTWEGAE